jgi:hypothetical protein
LKILGKVLALLALCASTTAFAQDSSCTPYKVAIENTVMECGQGQMGSKYRTREKVCPSGVVTESETYDTSGCQVAPTGSGGTMSREASCRLTPGACAPTPIAASCPIGQKWSLMGTGIAHCVDEDPVCPWGTSLRHDSLGNPSCVANTCPSNQTLQSDGISCGCSSGLVWNGSSCVPPTPSCYAGSATTASASCTYGGTMYYREQTTCPSGPYGAPYTTGYWDESGCAAQPVTCTSDSYTESASCSGGMSGQQYRQVYTNCPSGAYGSPSTSYGAWNTNECTSACTPSSTTTATSCPSGYSGTAYTTTTYSCPSGTPPQSTTDYSGCSANPPPSCANGASDYPTCTPPPPPTCNNGASDYPTCTPPPPPPVTCGPWVKTGPFGKGTCYSETMDWTHTYERSCSDGTTQTDSIDSNTGPCTMD